MARLLVERFWLIREPACGYLTLLCGHHGGDATSYHGWSHRRREALGFASRDEAYAEVYLYREEGVALFAPGRARVVRASVYRSEP